VLERGFNKSVHGDVGLYESGFGEGVDAEDVRETRGVDHFGLLELGFAGAVCGAMVDPEGFLSCVDWMRLELSKIIVEVTYNYKHWPQWLRLLHYGRPLEDRMNRKKS